MQGPDRTSVAKQALLAFGVCSVLAALLGLQLPQSIRIAAYMHVAPLATALALIALCVLLAGRTWSTFRSRDIDKATLIDVCVALSLVLLIATFVPGTLRVESDESNLLATSYGLLHTGIPEAFQSGIYDAAGVLEPRTAQLDKRGLLFPMLLVPLHAVLGFDSLNGVRFNLFSGVLALWWLIALARPTLGPLAARAAACLLAATPAFALAVRSGGFDVANLAGLLGTLLALRASLRHRSAAWGWIAVLAAGLLAQLRYEAILPAGAVALVMALHLRRPGHEPSTASRWLPLAAAPFLLIPALWRQAVPLDLEMLHPIFPAFSLGNAIENLQGLLVWLLVPDLGRNGLPILGWLAVLTCIQLGMSLARGNRPRWDFSWWPMVVALALCLAITLAYWWGQARLAATARLFLPWIALFACIAALGLARTGLRLGRALLLVILAPALASGLAAAASGNDLVQMKEALRVRAVEDTLRREAPGCRILVLDQRAGEFIVRGWSSLTPYDGLERWPTLEAILREGTIERIAAVGTLPRDPDKSAPGTWTASIPQAGGQSLLWWWQDPLAVPCEGRVPAPAGIDPAASRTALRLHVR